MLSLLNSKKIRSWCLFDFGISSYPTLILTFFYGAFYAKEIANDPNLGASFWGYALSSASIICFLLLSFTLIFGKSLIRKIKTVTFKFFFYSMILSSLSLFFFDEDSNHIAPLIVVVISFVSFEFVNLFYNITLFKIKSRNNEGALSNLGWAFGYLGGLLSLFSVYLLLKLTFDQDYKIYNITVFTLIGPFVALWTAVFGYSLFSTLRNSNFEAPDILELVKNIKSESLLKFLISYFFFNNAVISIFAFASMFAAFLFGMTEAEILFLGVFINLSGVLGCLIVGKYEDQIGSLKTVKICIIVLLVLTTILFFISHILSFWIVALFVGFFIGPIQASSRSFLVKKIKSKNQMSAFSLYSMFGNLCSILGPFLVGLTIDLSDSIKAGLIVIPVFFLISLIPFIKFNLRVSV
tara:strand:- start:447 stop:1673 length:1227 start_codon:yes stop_codon:yes gene_type:complete